MTLAGASLQAQQKPNFYVEINELKNQVSVLARLVRQNAYLQEVNTTGLLDSQIDEIVFGNAEGLVPILDGKVISDPVNGALFVRQNKVWKKIE